MNKVYSKDNCPYCVKAKNLLNARGIEFTEIKIGVDITRDEFLEAFPNARTVPQIILEGEHIGGYTKLVEYLK
jgi:glutaredoxin 3